MSTRKLRIFEEVLKTLMSKFKTTIEKGVWEALKY